MSILYAKGGKIYCNEYVEIYIPMEYFSTEVAINRGSMIETLGITYIRAFKDGTGGPIQLLNIPTTASFMVYESKFDTIKVGSNVLDVMTLQYMKDSYIVHQTIPKGREVANEFLDDMLHGKLPHTLNYTKIIDIWWKNLEISGISYKVPSKMFEMIIASIYRNPKNTKQRYGEYFGSADNPTGYDYDTENVRTVVKDLSTFSGIVFEDMGTMISNGINNANEKIEEPVSPLEKIIHY